MKTNIELNTPVELNCTWGNTAAPLRAIPPTNKVGKTPTNLKFNIVEFKNAIKGTDIVINEFDILEEYGLVYVTFSNSDIAYMRAPLLYGGKNNCINIYHGEGKKNGFWWDKHINYDLLVKELLKYHKSS